MDFFQPCSVRSVSAAGLYIHILLCICTISALLYIYLYARSYIYIYLYLIYFSSVISCCRVVSSTPGVYILITDLCLWFTRIGFQNSYALEMRGQWLFHPCDVVLSQWDRATLFGKVLAEREVPQLGISHKVVRDKALARLCLLPTSVRDKVLARLCLHKHPAMLVWIACYYGLHVCVLHMCCVLLRPAFHDDLMPHTWTVGWLFR